MEPTPKPTDPARPPAAHLAGWVTVALAEGVAAASRPRGKVPASALLTAYLVDALHLIAIGLALTAAALLLRRLAPRRPRLGPLVAALFAAALAYPLLAEDLSGPAGRVLKGAPFALKAAALALALSAGLPLAAWIGGLLARRRLRFLAVLAALPAAIANGVLHPETYAGLHLLAACLAATLISAAFRGAPPLLRLAPRARRAALAALALASAAAVLIPPGNTVAKVLSTRPGAVLAPYLARAYPPLRAPAVIPPEQRPWFADRAALPAVPPSTPSLLPPRPIVILLGVDSLRADLLADERYRDTLPSLFALKDRAVWFSQARSAGSSTAPSLAAVFSGRYYSQLHWSRRARRGDGLPFPHADPTPRFPELLTRAGIHTYTADATGWLDGRHGIVRGFEEEEDLHGTTDYGHARPMISALVKRLRLARDQPLFAFLHLLEGHFPYRAGGKRTKPKETYLRALAVADREIGHLLDLLERPDLARRVTLVVLSDHGEAFGEHGLHWHAGSLYDELLRVPLLVALPEGKPRVVDEPVSLIDVGPTILDLMGVETPGVYMGESLVPYLRGRRPTLHRPIVAEGRLKRAMVLPDGFKVVHDTRGRYVEVFDLQRDPRETVNRFQDGAPSERFGVLDAFFAANTLKRAGYSVPYRKW